VHERGQEQHHGAGRQLLTDDLLGGSLQSAHRRRVTATHSRDVDVLLVPHHSLGETGGAAGVRDIEVVTRTTSKVARRRRAVEGDRVVDRALDGRGVGAVVDDGHLAQLRRRATGGRNRVPEPAVVCERDEICVLIQMRQLETDIPVVHVDRHCSDLESAEHRLEVFGTVEELQAYVITRPYPEAGECMRGARRAFVQLCVGVPSSRGRQSLAVGHGVGHSLEQL
jgi:hypothetical protein